MRVTIVTPVYNGMPYLSQAITALLAQSFTDFKLVVVDDGSTDTSLQYLETIRDPRLTILRTGRRGGQGSARNLVIHSCDTEYIAFADADDVSLPDRLERQVAYMDEHPAIGMLGSHFRYLSRSGRLAMSPSLALDHETIRQDLLAQRHAIANTTLIFRTASLQRAGGFRIAGAGEDVDLFLRMTEETRVANLPEILCLYRVHPTSTNAQQARTLVDRYGHASECARLREKGLPETSYEKYLARQAKRSWWHRSGEELDMRSLQHYRQAIILLLEGAKLRGYLRLFASALLSPQRVAKRLNRERRGRATVVRESSR